MIGQAPGPWSTGMPDMPSGGSWSAPGEESPMEAWRYDLKRGWLAPGKKADSNNLQAVLPAGENPNGMGKWSFLVTPPGQQAPPHLVNYTPQGKLTSSPGQPAPIDQTNLSLLPSVQAASASSPAASVAAPPPQPSALPAGGMPQEIPLPAAGAAPPASGMDVSGMSIAEVARQLAAALGVDQPAVGGGQAYVGSGADNYRPGQRIGPRMALSRLSQEEQEEEEPPYPTTGPVGPSGPAIRPGFNSSNATRPRTVGDDWQAALDNAGHTAPAPCPPPVRRR